jgi:hypothetical protein
MKLLRILSLIAAAAGLLIIGACKSRDVAPAYAQPDVVPSAVAPGAYIDSGK